MNRLSLFFLVVAILVVGCAVQPPPPPPTGTAFTGEVWTWDPTQNTVTLRQGTQHVRVKVTPDRLRDLRAGQVVTVRGELAPPAPIETVVAPSAALVAVPRGTAEQVELGGRVTSVDAQGRMTVATARGPLHVLAAPGADTRFHPGSPVTVLAVIQPVDMVPVSRVPTPAAADPAASPAPQPGDYSVVRGRILRTDTAGSLLVEAPQGSVEVRVADPTRYRVGESVQVRTKVTLR